MFLRIFVALGLASAFNISSYAQEQIKSTGGPDRGVPPTLSKFLQFGDEASQSKIGMSLFEVERISQENTLLKQSLQELQLDRIELMMQDQGERGNVLRNSVWPARTIEVNWENPDAAPAEERKWVQDVVERTWSQYSGIRFTGWGTTTPSSRGIRIRIAEDGPHCKRLGRHLDGMPDGMVLNFTFQTWCPSCAIDRKGSIEKIAVHEFGHAIGFAHEQNRTDAPEWCKLERQGSDGDWYITIYDPDSIMNYCNPRWNNDGLLSPLDIRAVQILYGQSIPTPEPIFEPTPANKDDGRTKR